MIRLAVTTVDGGGVVDVVVPISVVIAWEAEHKRPLQNDIDSGMSQWSGEVAHAALVKRHGETRPYVEWLDTVDEVRMQPADLRSYFTAMTLGFSADAVDMCAALLMEIADSKRDDEHYEAPAVDAEVPTGGEATPSPDASPAS